MAVRGGQGFANKRRKMLAAKLRDMEPEEEEAPTPTRSTIEWPKMRPDRNMTREEEERMRAIQNIFGTNEGDDD